MAVNMEGASPPVFEQIFRNARFAQGGNALFEGKVAGSPRPQVVWTRKGLQMKGSDKHQMMYDEASGKVSLLIKAIGPGDEGEYTCTALNPYGEAICTVYISPEATKQVKKSRSGHKLHKSKSGHDQQLLVQQQQQQQVQQQQQQQQQQVQQQQTSMKQQFSQQSSSSFQQSSSQQMVSGFQQSSSVQQSAGFQQSSSSFQQQQQQSSSSFQQSSVSSSNQQQSMLKETEPEVIYLKHVERSAASQKKEEVVQRYSTPSFMTPLKDITVNEGERAHFEAKVAPVGDPSMVVEWYYNGSLIPASSRINTTCQFGFVSMDMINAVTCDVGEYTCVVKSDSGTVNSSCRLMINARKEIASEMHSQSLRTMETTQVQQQVIVQEEAVPAPKFTQPLRNLGERPEGSSVKLEAQVSPTSDSTMKVEWFKDGRPITASSRIGTIFSFGYVSLNISDLRHEDAGQYTCRAINKSGEDQTSASFTVKASQTMTASTGLEEQHSYIQKTEQLEMYQASKQTKMESVIEPPSKAPEFKTNIKDQGEVKEGGFAHFEARLEPMGDHTMKVEWLKDGRPVEASSRITSFFNFGYVALTIKQVAIHDMGSYSCVATNAIGTATTTAKLQAVTKAEADFQAKTWESCQQIETKKIETSMEIQQEITSSPNFVSSLKGTNVILEGQKAHFECRVEPQNDPKLNIQWYHNGQTITASSRIQTYFDFGYVAIDITNVVQEDSGTYTLVATNALGTEQASTELKVDAHAQVDYSSIHTKAVEETKRFEAKQEVRHEFQDMTPHGPPVFKTTLAEPQPVSEGQNIHMEARLEPIGDPSMRVEWFFNGRPLTIGSRFKTYNDFGFIALDIMGVICQDQGQYVCRASNNSGEAATNANVQVMSKSNIVTETEHENAMQQINYLETQRVHLCAEEEAVKAAPTFSKPLKNTEAAEGQNIHLEARLSPTGDSTMRVEWTVNGKPLKTGHRFRPAYDFDYVALDLLSVYPEDSGVYTCHARNAYGEAVTSATIKICGASQIVSESHTEMSQFQYLEQKKSGRVEMEESSTSQVPVFTGSLKSIEVMEGQKAHFECRIIPVSDPTLKVEWLLNGAPIKQGSRFREGLDFGFVSLDIMHVLPEDAGQYTCRATNILGQAVSSCQLKVQANQTILKDTIHESALQQINYLESQRVTQTQEEGFTTQAPVFTASMKDHQVIEGAPAHFEAKLIPIGDPKLRVDWFKDGKPIQASNRMSTLHDFGFVAMDLKYTRPEDTGTYSVKAYNALGEASISANLKVISAKGGADMETIHGEALNKISYLENKKVHHALAEEDVPTSAPVFVSKLQGKSQLLEGQNGHMECRIDPYPDATLKVEWFHNGKPLPFGNRWKTTYDFGFAALDILGAYAADSGRYTIKATNILGSAESSIDINVATGKGLLLDSEHQDALEKIKYLESKHQRTAEEEMAAPEAPQFGHPLKSVKLDEGQPAHFETTLTPVNDSTMRVEWLFNGKAIPQGHRFRTTYDFGFVALDILYAYPEDSGTYTCHAKNVLGETRAECSLQVTGKSGLLLDTMDKDRLNQLRNLEHKPDRKTAEMDAPITKPVFTTPLNNVEDVVEGAHVHLECRLEPVNDPNLHVEWFVNGKAIKTGHRFRTTHDFGFVALDILYAYSEDTGTYMCKATNKLGEAVNTAGVSVQARKGLMLDSQHPEGWEKMRDLEARRHVARLQVEETTATAPRFVAELQGSSNLAEGQTAHFEAKLEPIHDPNLKVEFLHNGKPLQQASRIHTVCDFGYVALDIGQLITQDSGTYVCRAYNKLGEVRSQVNLNVSGKGGLDTSSQHPEGLDKIRELEGRGHRAREDEIVTFQQPMFTVALNNVVKEENQSAHMAARLIPVGDPSMKVEWFKDGKLLETGSRINTVNDFGHVSLDITGLRESDVGIYECKARNALGTAVTTASVEVHAKGSLLLDSQHPEGMQKITALEFAKVKRQVSEQDQQFGKPVFTTPLSGTSDVGEGKAAHMECRVVPVGDPNMTFDWCKNGENLKMGSRFSASHDFGFVTLDIAQCIPEDAGMYTITAKNFTGETSSSFALHVGGRGGVQGESMHPEAFKKLAALEAGKGMKKEMVSEAGPDQPPVFMVQLKEMGTVTDGQNIHMDAKVEPANDPNLRIEWELNGKALNTGSRIKTSLDFGLVTLDIASIRTSDVGIYTCKAINLKGEATSTTSIKVQDSQGIQGLTQHPGAMDKIRNLEAPKIKMSGESDVVYEIPTFMEHLNNVECKEKGTAIFECKVEPAKDPTMRIDWQFNGRPLPSGSRFIPTFDFGFVKLEIKDTVVKDAGMFKCTATNNKGMATTSGTLKMLEDGAGGVKTGTLHPTGVTGLEAIKKADKAASMKLILIDEDEVPEGEKPRFTTDLPAEVHLSDGKPLNLECQVEPKQDANLRIDWYHNGIPLSTGSRVKASSDFGLVILDIADISDRDQGIYTCKAVNKLGEATTFTKVFCSGKGGIDFATQHPKGSEALESISNIEAKISLPDQPEVEETPGVAPKFTTPFNNLELEQGAVAHFEAMLEPIKDSGITLEWLLNGKPLGESSRFKKVHAFGMVIFEIMGIRKSDAGTYTCIAKNKTGSDSATFNLKYAKSSNKLAPKFTTQLKDITNLRDGESVHFECRLTPTNDQNLKVEWKLNGKPLPHSSRIKTVSDFGFVMLDISNADSSDSGEYICRAYNKYGEDTTRAVLGCSGKGGVIYDSINPNALAQIKRLETDERSVVDGKEREVGPPKFVTQVASKMDVSEGQSSHFEARLTPVDDPNMKVEWFKDGKPLPTGHRFRTFNDFGIVILDILYCYGEDSGTYECRATNKLGSDTTKGSVSCSEKSGLILTPQVPGEMVDQTLERIQSLESHKMKMTSEGQATSSVAPRFTSPINNITDLKEGENAHFEARLLPTDDPHMTIEWFWNKKALKAGSRIRTFCDFGFVILEISPVYPEDAGEYTCRAKNALGEAVTSATLQCSGKRNIILDSQLPSGMEGAMDRIAQLEGLGRRADVTATAEDLNQPPEFLSTLADLLLAENSLAHFETRLTPINDPSMKVEWFHNGKQLSAGSRIKTINDFGFVILEVANVLARDSGNYTCKAINKHGEASISCQVQVSARGGIISDPQLPKSFRSGTDSLHQLEERMWKREDITYDELESKAPVFVTKPENVVCFEGQSAHFDCRVEPIGDGSMRIEWYHDDQPIQIGSRIHTINDFGFVVLDIDWTFKRDSGTYKCVATNKVGASEVEVKLTCRSKKDIIMDSQLPEGMSAEHLKDLEKGKAVDRSESETEHTVPKFITQIKSRAVGEGEPAHFECRVEPKHDPKLQIKWYHNGQEVDFGHRFRLTFEFGYVALDILYTYPEDQGEYVCKALNELGEDITRAELRCKELPAIQLENQVPKGMKKSEYLLQMEASMKKYTQEIFLTEDDVYDSEKRQPPRFVTQIQSVTNLEEMQATKFECQLAPVGDPSMKLEWFFNGKPLPFKTRFTPIYDFGYVAMNFSWVYPEDSGEYICRATNLYGHDETRAIIKSSGKPGIVYESQLPKGMMSIEKIREMESGWQRAPDLIDQETEKFKPCFVTKPEPITTTEGGAARFCCRVTGYPKPRVMWLINGHTVINGSKHKLIYDGMWHLDIPKCRDMDGGKIEVIARNQCGEAYATTTLTVQARRDDYRSVLRHNVKPFFDDQHEHCETSSSRQEMYTEQRKETLAQQVSSLHHTQQVKSSSTEVSAEAQEWQTLAKKEKSYTSYAESSHFSMQNMSAPAFTKSLEPVTVSDGETAVFTVEFGGQPNPVVKWYRYSFPVKDSKDFQILTTDTSSTLTILKTCADDSGIFTCLLENIVGAAKSSSNLNVVEQGQEYVMEASTRTVTRSIVKEMNVTAGDNIRFDIGFSGGEKSNLEFTHNGNKIEEASGIKISVENEVASLLIENAKPEHSGLYECIMKTEGGEARCQVKCQVVPS